MLKATIEGEAVRAAIAQLKEIDPKMEIYLKREIRSGLSGPAAAIQKAYPSRLQSPSKMNALGPTQYDGNVKATVSVTPGVARRGRVSTLIGIRLKLPKGAAGAWIAEMAGLRGDYKTGDSRNYVKYGSAVDSKGNPYSHKLKGQGEAMVNALNQKYGSADKGGRFGWRKFVNMKGNIQNIGIGILNKYVDQLNRED
jgi:hypothetical protein